jgi:hypothetical protein
MSPTAILITSCAVCAPGIAFVEFRLRRQRRAKRAARDLQLAAAHHNAVSQRLRAAWDYPRTGAIRENDPATFQGGQP